ncbi:hypothetical protein HDU67_001628 [Dinochytrium kinnereticum]|nr:hypothetical protein HDU67_001628 [Dinochytrium kinnereticum]
MYAIAVFCLLGLAIAARGAPQAGTSPRPLSKMEPPDGKVILAGWLDTANEPNGRDSPLRFNTRIGQNAGGFQFAQEMPLADNPWIPGEKLPVNLTLLDDMTDAMLMITVYPYTGLDRITATDITLLSDQIAFIKNTTGRDVMVRFAPEMNGGWMQYGLQPTAYIREFRNIARVLHARNPTAAMLWSPNMDSHGDSYSAYYPGDEHVDWVGLSVYYKGRIDEYPWIRNFNAPPGYMEMIINGLPPEGGYFSFYRTYAEEKGKPFALSEGAASYHTNYTMDFNNGPWYETETATTIRDLQLGFQDDQRPCLSRGLQCTAEAIRQMVPVGKQAYPASNAGGGCRRNGFNHFKHLCAEQHSIKGGGCGVNSFEGFQRCG